MKIGSQLPQFDQHPVIFLVASLHEIRLLKCDSGEIKEIYSEKVSLPEHDDKPGRFEARGGGKVIRSGAVTEHDKGESLRYLEIILKDYWHHKLDSDFEQIYVFCPNQAWGVVEKSIPKDILDKTVFIKEGNFIKDHPFDLLENVKKQQTDKKVVLTDPEAEKILKKGEQ